MLRHCCVFFTVLLFTDGCIDRYEIPNLLHDPVLVVDGMVTDQPGQYAVRLATSFDINSAINNAVPVAKAFMQIIDEAGNKENMIESLQEPGTYMSSGLWQGQIGKKYSLYFRINDKEYQTSPQELMPPGEIDDLDYYFEEHGINPTDPSLPQDVLHVDLDANGVEGFSNFLRWRWTSTYEIVNMPELKTIQAGRPPRAVPVPPPCSGYYAGGINGITRFDICTCCNCWITEHSDRSLLSNNRFLSQARFENVRIADIPVDIRRFNVRFYLRVDQLSVSSEVYQYWSLIRAQQEGEGSLFVPNSVKVVGNVKSLSNPDEKVLGAFAVCGITSREFFIDRKDVPLTLPLDTVKESCLLYQPKNGTRSSNKRPLFW